VYFLIGSVTSSFPRGTVRQFASMSYKAAAPSLQRSVALCSLEAIPVHNLLAVPNSAQNSVFWHFLYTWGICNGTQIDYFEFHTRSYFRPCPDVLTTIHRPPDVLLKEFGFRLGDKWRLEWCKLPSFINKTAKQGSSWGVYSSSVSQETPRIWKLRVHYHAQTAYQCSLYQVGLIESIVSHLSFKVLL